MPPKTFRESEVISRYVHELVRRRALKTIAAHDEKLSKVFDRIAEGVRRDLRASGYTISEVRAILEKHSRSSRNRSATRRARRERWTAKHSMPCSALRRWQRPASLYSRRSERTRQRSPWLRSAFAGERRSIV
jgi:antitoxin (DNA-binding transcriptional repressor) of toxin-antitoxin stability system